MPIRRSGSIKCPFDDEARCSGEIVAERRSVLAYGPGGAAWARASVAITRLAARSAFRSGQPAARSPRATRSLGLSASPARFRSGDYFQVEVASLGEVPDVELDRAMDGLHLLPLPEGRERVMNRPDEWGSAAQIRAQVTHEI